MRLSMDVICAAGNDDVNVCSDDVVIQVTDVILFASTVDSDNVCFVIMSSRTTAASAEGCQISKPMRGQSRPRFSYPSNARQETIGLGQVRCAGWPYLFRLIPNTKREQTLLEF